MSTEEPRDILLEAALALSVISEDDKAGRLQKETDVLVDLLELIQGAHSVNVSVPHPNGPRVLLCQLCGQTVSVPPGETGFPTLLDMLQAVQGHTCPSVTSVAVDKARQAMESAMSDLEVEGADRDFVRALVHHTLALVHEVVKVERARVSEEYRNSGVDSTPDLDALDRVVGLTEPERVLDHG